VAVYVFSPLNDNFSGPRALVILPLSVFIPAIMINALTLVSHPGFKAHWKPFPNQWSNF